MSDFSPLDVLKLYALLHWRITLCVITFVLLGAGALLDHYLL